jgi:hypothetical protein
MPDVIELLVANSGVSGLRSGSLWKARNTQTWVW